MKATALALAVGLAAAGPTWAQDAEPVREKRLEAERHLVPCEQVPDSEPDCRAITRRFLDAYDKATRGHWSSRLTVGSMLILGGRVPGKPQFYVVPDPVEGCAWRIVVADDHPDRNFAIGLRTLCNRLTAPDRAAAEERAQSLRQDIAPTVFTNQAAVAAERLAEAQRPEAQSRQSAAALWRGERPTRPPPTTPAPDAPVVAEPPESGHAQQPRPLDRSRAEETARKAGVVVADAAHCGAAPTRLARVQGSTEAALALLGRDDRERTAAVRMFHEARETEMARPSRERNVDCPHVLSIFRRSERSYGLADRETIEHPLASSGRTEPNRIQRAALDAGGVEANGEHCGIAPARLAHIGDHWLAKIERQASDDRERIEVFHVYRVGREAQRWHLRSGLPGSAIECGRIRAAMAELERSFGLR